MSLTSVKQSCNVTNVSQRLAAACLIKDFARRAKIATLLRIDGATKNKDVRARLDSINAATERVLAMAGASHGQAIDSAGAAFARDNKQADASHWDRFHEWTVLGNGTLRDTDDEIGALFAQVLGSQVHVIARRADDDKGEVEKEEVANENVAGDEDDDDYD